MFDKAFLLLNAIAVFILLLLLNFITPLFGNDWVYLGIYRVAEFTRVENLNDIFYSQYLHYIKWGGRSVVHFVDQFLLMISSFSRSVIKSAFFVVFVLIMHKLCSKGRSLPLLFYFIVAFVFFFMLRFDETILWTTGAANYLFGTTIVLLFFYPFYTFYIDEIDYHDGSRVFSVFIFVFGIIAGWTNENTVASLLFGILILFLYIILILKRRIPAWMIFGFIGFVIGFIIMIVAPGNYIRFNQILISENLSDYTSTEILYLQLKNILNYYVLEKKIVLLLFIYLILLFCTLINKNVLSKKIIKGS